MMLLAETVSAVEEAAVATATAAAENLPKQPVNMTPFYVIGIVGGLALAIFLAIRKANKLYGKGWD